MDKGISILTDAKIKDRAGDNRQAMELYLLGSQYLLFAIKCK